jgi:hypothetical protein
MSKSISTSLIGRGILAVAVGIIAIAWPSVTVLALVILFAVYAFWMRPWSWRGLSAAVLRGRSSATCFWRWLISPPGSSR